MRGTHRGPLNSPYKWPVTRKMFPFDDVIILGIENWINVLKVSCWFKWNMRIGILIHYWSLHMGVVYLSTEKWNCPFSFITFHSLQLSWYVLLISTLSNIFYNQYRNRLSIAWPRNQNGGFMMFARHPLNVGHRSKGLSFDIDVCTR